MEYVRDLVTDNFKRFLTRNLFQYEYLQYPVYFAGKTAVTFAPLLRAVCRDAGFEPARVSNSVVEGLMKYHATHPLSRQWTWCVTFPGYSVLFTKPSDALCHRYAFFLTSGSLCFAYLSATLRIFQMMKIQSENAIYWQITAYGVACVSFASHVRLISRLEHAFSRLISVLLTS